MTIEFRAHGRAPDDWPMNGLRGWGLGSRVLFPLNGVKVEGIAKAAVLDRGDRDPYDPGCWTVCVARKGFEIAVEFELLEPATEPRA